MSRILWSASSISVFVMSLKHHFRFWPDVLGVMALFLPFTHDISPVDLFSGREGYEGLSILALPMALAIPIAGWQALRVLRDVILPGERLMAYALSAATLIFAGFLIISAFESFGSQAPYLLASAVTIILIVANGFLLWRNLKSGAPSEISAGVFLVGGYLPNAVFYLVFFCSLNRTTLAQIGPYYVWWLPFWDIGGYVVLIVCIGYILRIISLMRHGTKAYRPVESSG